MTKESKNTLEESFYKTISDPAFNITSDMIEIGIDNILDEGILKDIPIVNSLRSIVKAGFSISERLFLKKLSKFMVSSKTDRNSEKFKNFIKKIESKNEKDELSLYLLELLDKTTEQIKIPLYSKLFDYIINNELDWNDFFHLSICLNNLHPLGIDFIKEIMGNATSKENINIPRDYRENFLSSAGLSSRYGAQIHLNELGKKLYSYCIK